MKNTTVKLFCFLFFIILSSDVYSQLKPPKNPDDGGGKCWEKYSIFTYCPEFDLPIDLLTFDTDSPDANGCFPVNNFGCDLHIGLTYDGDESTTTYKQITSCDVAKIRDAYDHIDDALFVHWPSTCISIPIREDMCDVDLLFSFDLFCKDSNGDFTPISEVASIDVDNNYDEVFPGSEPKSVIEEESWIKRICCKDPEPITIGTPGGFSPDVGQDDNGTTAFVRNLKDANNTSISIFDANYQSVDISNRLTMVSNTEYSIDISNLNQGVYHVRVVEDGIVYSKSIVKL